MTHFYKEFAHFSQINNATAESGFCFCRTHTRGGGEEKNDKTITSVSDGFVFVVNKNKPVTNTFDPRNRPWWMHWFETSVKKSTRTFFPAL